MANICSSRCRTHCTAPEVCNSTRNWLWLDRLLCFQVSQSRRQVSARFQSQLRLGWRRIHAQASPVVDRIQFLAAVGPRAPCSRWVLAGGLCRLLAKPPSTPKGFPSSLLRGGPQPGCLLPQSWPWRESDPGGFSWNSGVKKLPTNAGDWVGPLVWESSRRHRAAKPMRHNH